MILAAFLTSNALAFFKRVHRFGVNALIASLHLCEWALRIQHGDNYLTTVRNGTENSNGSSYVIVLRDMLHNLMLQ